MPFIHKGETMPRPSKRVRPEDALDLKYLVDELHKNALGTVRFDSSCWSVVTVLSPYSPNFHVMVIETNTNRYVPGPDWLPDTEGEALMALWAVVLDFIAQNTGSETVHVGYNWSPRAWGEEEERTGGQSVPTKWHLHLWGWPNLSLESEYVKWVEVDCPKTKRLLGENEYVKPLAQLIQARLQQEAVAHPAMGNILDQEWSIDERGLRISFPGSSEQMLQDAPEFFSRVLKPIGAELTAIATELTEIMTSISCHDLDEILLQTESGPLGKNDIAFLRSRPRMRSKEYITRMFDIRSYPNGLYEALYQPIFNRCEHTGDPADWWRKGFSYAWVLSCDLQKQITELRITPYLYVGDGGVVEARGVELNRPDAPLSIATCKEKSKMYYDLDTVLRKKFGNNYISFQKNTPC